MTAPVWTVIGASVAGTSHQAAGRECEDAWDWRADRDLACLAVADGAGSQPLSRRGAMLAVERALLTASGCARDQATGDPQEWLHLTFGDVRDQITALATAEGRPAADYAATLAVAVLTGNVAVIGQIGDTIAVIGHQDRYETAAPARGAEYVNETTFITAPDALEQARITVRPATDVDSVFLATDGLRFKILHDLATGAPFAPFFEDLAAYARSPGASQDAVSRFLASLDDQSGDDKTLIAAVRAP